MSGRWGDLGRGIGFALVAVVFAVTQPLILVAVPLALLVAAHGPRTIAGGVIVAVALALVLTGQRSSLWWFERGWPLVLGGGYLWMTALRPDWSFSARGLATLAFGATLVGGLIAVRPAVWRDLDAAMSRQALQSMTAAVELLGTEVDDTLRTVLRKAATLQSALFPALLGISSLGALGCAVTIRDRLARRAEGAVGALRSFRFNDHLIWIWLLGLVLLLAPAGELAERIGGNAVLFMGTLYVTRGSAVLLSLAGGISTVTAVLGGLAVLLLYPLLALVLVIALVVGVGDTWLNVRARARARERDGESDG